MHSVGGLSKRMAKPLPVVDPGTAPYWKALTEHKFILKSCRDCGRAHFYPREACPHCYSDNLEWKEAKGQAEIYSFTVCHRPAGPAFAEDVPYVVAVVELDEGPRMMTRIDGDISAVKIGHRARIKFHEAGEGVVLPYFTIVAEGAGHD
jgi:uncharacterized OB-fold protein